MINSNSSISAVSPFEQNNKYKMSYEVLDGSLHVSSVIEGQKNVSEKKSYKLGATYKHTRSRSGLSLYWGEKAYIIDIYGNVEKIAIPERCKGSLLEYDVLEHAFVHNDIFVVYKSPQNRSENGQCFFYDAHTKMKLTVEGNKDFHNTIIGNVENVHMYCRDIIRGYVILDIGHSLQKFALQHITSDTEGSYNAIISDVEIMNPGSITITPSGRIMHASHDAHVRFQGLIGKFIFTCTDTAITVTDVEQDVTHSCILTKGIEVTNVLLDTDGNIILTGYEEIDSHCIILLAKRSSLYQDVKRYVLPYSTIHAIHMGHSTSWYTELVYIAKKHNSPREIAVMRIQSEGYDVFTTIIPAGDIENTMYITYDASTYKIASLSEKKNPFVIKNQWYTLSDNAKQVREHNKRIAEKQKQLTYYEKEVLDKNGLSYEDMAMQYKSMENFVEVMKTFLTQFSIQNKKNILGHEKELMEFDHDKTLSLCKNIIAHPLYKKIASNT